MLSSIATYRTITGYLPLVKYVSRSNILTEAREVEPASKSSVTSTFLTCLTPPFMLTLVKSTVLGSSLQYFYRLNLSRTDVFKSRRVQPRHSIEASLLPKSAVLQTACSGLSFARLYILDWAVCSLDPPPARSYTESRELLPKPLCWDTLTRGDYIQSNFGCGGWNCTTDLLVMSQTSCYCSTPQNWLSMLPRSIRFLICFTTRQLLTERSHQLDMETE